MIWLCGVRKFIFAPQHTSLYPVRTNQFDYAAGNRPLTESAIVSGHLWEHQAVSRDALLSVTRSHEAVSCVAHSWYFPQHILHRGVWPSYFIRDLKNGWVWNAWCAQINTNLLYWIQKHSSVYKSMLYSLNYYVNIKVPPKILLQAIFGQNSFILLSSFQIRFETNLLCPTFFHLPAFPLTVSYNVSSQS